MNVLEILDELQQQARKDETLRARLLETVHEKDPLQAFCRIGRSYGYELYPMELIVAGEEFHAQMKRSTNGGGENSPKLTGEDDLYEDFFAGF